jgi:site-specific DNA-methyltransferase (adenine-specific)
MTAAENIDCMVGMSRYPDKWFDLVIADPPYGESDAINPESSQSVYAAKRGNYKEFENIAPLPEFFAELDRVAKSGLCGAVTISASKEV